MMGIGEGAAAIRDLANTKPPRQQQEEGPP
jgi:hypothetical protein